MQNNIFRKNINRNIQITFTCKYFLLHHFFHLPPSCMVASIRELVNILFPSIISDFLFISSIKNSSNIDMKIDTPRGRSVSSSVNSSRELSTHLSVSSISYHKRMEIQSNSLPWSKQVEIDKREKFSLSYTTLRVEKNIPVNEAANNSLKERV